MRKNLLFPAILLFSCFRLSAQVEKNQLYGEISFGRRLFNYNTNNIQPSFSIGINEHSTLGVFYNHTRYKTMPSPYFSFNEYSTTNAFGISYTYYRYFKKSKKWGWYLNGSFGLDQVSVYYKQAGVTGLNNRYWQRELSITPGIFFKPSQRVMLFANIGSATLYNNTYESLNLRSSFAGQVNIGIRISIGNIGGKTKKRH